MLVLVCSCLAQFGYIKHNFRHRKGGLGMSYDYRSKGVDERIEDFLEGWNQRKEEAQDREEPLSCTRCGSTLTDGNFIMVDGEMVCTKCKNKT